MATNHKQQRTPEPYRHWNGINWFGGWFDNEADARAWGKMESDHYLSVGGDGRYDIRQDTEGPEQGKWFARVHCR